MTLEEYELDLTISETNKIIKDRIMKEDKKINIGLLCESFGTKVFRVAKKQLLKEIVKGEELREVPRQTRRYGENYAFLVEIGRDDDYAIISMLEDTYTLLMEEKQK